jgi:hypothetical protein
LRGLHIVFYVRSSNDISTMQETSDTRVKECINGFTKYNIDNTELTRRTLNVLHDFQREISRECHLQHVSASQEINILETIFLNRKINELDGFNDVNMNNDVHLNEEDNPKPCQLAPEYTCFAPKISLAVSSLLEALSKNNSNDKKIPLCPMDILFKADTQGSVPQLMRGISNPGTSRLKILIHLYSEKFAGETTEEHRKSIMGEIMHTLEDCWKSRFILYDELMDDHVAYGKILPSEVAEIFVRSLFLTEKSEKCQLSSSLIEGTTPRVISNKRILSSVFFKAESSSLDSNTVMTLKSKRFSTDKVSKTLIKLKKYESLEEPITSFPEHKAAVEALKLKRKKREIMARVTRQRSLDRDSMTTPACPDVWYQQS